MIQYPLGAAGTLTRVLEAGQGDRTMLLVHGVGARADRWCLNLDAFAEAGYHAYAIDLPGHGLAEKGSRFDHSVPNYAAFARAVLDQVGAGEVYLVGTSLGGHVLATVACEIPERVAGLVMVGTLGMAPIGQEARERTAGLIGDTTPEMVDRKLHSVIHDDGLVTAELHREEVRINNSPGAAEGFERVADYFANRIDDDVVGDRLAALGGRFPVLLVWGREDLASPGDGRGRPPDARRGRAWRLWTKPPTLPISSGRTPSTPSSPSSLPAASALSPSRASSCAADQSHRRESASAQQGPS